MKSVRWLVSVSALAALSGTSAVAGQQEQEGDKGALAKAVAAARVSLERGLAASASQGQPISGKFEIEEGNCSSPSIPRRAASSSR